MSIQEAIVQLHEWLRKEGVLGSEFAFLSCGDFDARALMREAKYKNFFVPNYLKRWINIKKVFPRHFYDEKFAKITDFKDISKHKAVAGGMPSMLNMCGLPLLGRHHSGTDDTINIA